MKSPAPETLESLMRLALAGNSSAYRQVLKNSAALLRPYVSRRIHPQAAVDDVLQEILLSVHKSRHTYDGERPYAPWLFAIARYRLTDYLRGAYKDKLRHAADISDYEAVLEAHVTESSDSFEYLNKVVLALPEKQGKILRLMYYMGYTAKETAAQLGMTETAVKVSAHRAYKLLKKKLEHDGNA